MSARLRVLTGAQEGQEVEVTGTATVGRLPGCTLPIPIQAVSREHAKIYQRDGDWFVVDLNSSNGTRVNGTKVTRHRLTDGDEIELGEVKIRFIAPADQAAGMEAGIPAEIGFDEPEPDVRVEPRIEPRSPRQEPLAPIPDVLDLGDIEVRARPREQTGLPGGRAGGGAPAGDIVVRDRILQYSKVTNRSGLLVEDISQRGPIFKTLVVVVLLAICAAAFYLTMTVVASGGGAPPDVETESEDGAGTGR
jgi:hypothetical protein